jgi:hypothetical protein
VADLGLDRFDRVVRAAFIGGPPSKSGTLARRRPS